MRHQQGDVFLPHGLGLRHAWHLRCGRPKSCMCKSNFSISLRGSRRSTCMVGYSRPAVLKLISVGGQYRQMPAKLNRGRFTFAYKAYGLAAEFSEIPTRHKNPLVIVSIVTATFLHRLYRSHFGEPSLFPFPLIYPRRVRCPKRRRPLLRSRLCE